MSDEIITYDNSSKKLGAIAQKLSAEENHEKSLQLMSDARFTLEKANIERSAKWATLQDRLAEIMLYRVENKSDHFSNQELLDYTKTLQSILEKSEAKITSYEQQSPTAAVQNIIVTGNDQVPLNQQSRQNVLEAVQKILHEENCEIVENEVTSNADTE